MKKVKLVSLIVALVGLAIILSASTAFAKSTLGDIQKTWQLGAGLWTPRDSDVFDSGAAFWGSVEAKNVALRLGLGTASWSNLPGAPDLTSAEIAMEYRFKSPVKPQQKMQWYAGGGLAFSSISTDYNDTTYTDNAIGPCISLGLTSGKLGVDLHSYWGEDSVNIGGTVLSLLYSF